MEDLEDAWDFVKKEQLESEDEDDEMATEQKEFKELSEEDLGKANNALQAHMLIISELKRKIEHDWRKQLRRQAGELSQSWRTRCSPTSPGPPTLRKR